MHAYFQKLKTKFVAKFKRLTQLAYYQQKWRELTHPKFKLPVSARELKRRARRQLAARPQAIYVVGLMRMSLLLIFGGIAFPIGYQMLNDQALAAKNAAYVPVVTNTEPFYLSLAAILLIIVLMRVWLTQQLLTDAKTTKNSYEFSPKGKLFGFEWINVSMSMTMKRFIGVCLGLIPFLIALILAAINNPLWPFVLSLTILVSFGYYLKARYTYDLALIESMTGYYGTRQAMSVARMRMHGHRWQLFHVALSFLCWDIANWFCLGLLSVYLAPYKIATLIEFRKQLIIQK